MKRCILVILLLSFIGFSSDILAYDVCNVNDPFVPCDYDSFTYNDFFRANTDYTFFYNQNPNALPSARLRLDNYNSYVFARDLVLLFWTGSSVVSLAGPYYDWNSYMNLSTFSPNNYISSRNIYNLFDTSSLLYPANYPPPVALSITRSPEVGGGVVVTVPPGFPEYQCGIDSYEVCDFDVDYNAQVTLEAVENEGYAFSHWEINSQTMVDVDGEIIITMSEGKEVEAVFVPVLNFPLSGTLESRNILSHFGDDWLTYCDGLIKVHTGIDIQATQNEIVSATGTGEIKLIFEDTSEYQWGWCIVIEHDGVYTTTYWHLNDPRNSEIYIGATVVSGQNIGTVKNMSTNTHLHLGVRMHTYTDDNISNVGALPQTPNCGGYPAYPELFLNPENLTYE